jgi:hypothetical protein
MFLWVTFTAVPAGYVALAAVEIIKDVVLVMVVIVTVNGFMIVAVNISVAVTVAAVVNVKLVALLTDVRTVSPAGILIPEIAVPARNDMVAGDTIVTMALPLVMLAVNVIVVVVVFGIPVPLMVIPWVKALVEAVVTIVLPLFVFAVIVEDTPLLTQGLREL